MTDQSEPNSEAGLPDAGSESAIYARYSGDKQRESSIEDQVRGCRKEAKRVDCFVPEANIFADREVRGALEHRPQLDRLVELVRSGRATFRDLFIADTSRLARNSALAPQLRKFFKHHGIRLHFVENGMKSGTSGFDLQHTFQAYFDEQFSEQLGEKVSRGQIGCVLKGYTPCGRCYGYRNVPDEHPTKIGLWGRPVVLGVRQVPYAEEVDVINMMCTMYASGEGGYGYIAQRLNEMEVLSPRKAQKNMVRGWNQATVRNILNNERYNGHVIFGKTKGTRNPETGKMTHPGQSESEWTTYDDPSLKIVPDELWEAVRARQLLTRDTFGGVKAGGMARSPASRSYLFGGLLRCGDCGGPMVLTNGARGTYKCSSARRKTGCKNNRNIRRETLERYLIESIASTIRSEVNFSQIKGLFMAALSAERKRQENEANSATYQRDTLVEERRQLTAALENLADEVANYGGSDALRSARRRKEARLTVVKELLERSKSPAKCVSEEEVDAFLRKAFGELGNILLGDPLRSKQELQKRISSLTLTPTVHEGSPAYAVSGSVTLFSGEEAVMLTRTRDCTSEHHSFDISLDGIVLKLDSRSSVIAVVNRSGTIDKREGLAEAA